MIRLPHAVHSPPPDIAPAATVIHHLRVQSNKTSTASPARPVHNHPLPFTHGFGVPTHTATAAPVVAQSTLTHPMSPLTFSQLKHLTEHVLKNYGLGDRSSWESWAKWYREFGLKSWQHAFSEHRDEVDHLFAGLPPQCRPQNPHRAHRVVSHILHYIIAEGDLFMESGQAPVLPVTICSDLSSRHQGDTIQRVKGYTVYRQAITAQIAKKKAGKAYVEVRTPEQKIQDDKTMEQLWFIAWILLDQYWTLFGHMLFI